jgi:hypothetical protein
MDHGVACATTVGEGVRCFVLGIDILVLDLDFSVKKATHKIQ